MFDSSNIANMIISYGDIYLLCIFFWTFLEGETIIILSGVAAKNGMILLEHIIFTAWSGAFLGDQLYFYIGRRWGGKILIKFERLRPSITKAIGFLENHSIIFIFTYRFIYAVRNVSPFAIGMSSISWRRFAILNFCAAGIWAIAFAGGGYLVGAAMEGVFGEIGMVLSGVMLVIIIFVAHRHYRQR